MINKTEFINSLIKEKGYQSYLEIGLGDGVNFQGISILNKCGVDPKTPIRITTGWTKDQTSDKFFEWYLKEVQDDPKSKFDLIFIDGLHHADQVERDIVNAWSCLNSGGAILIHDIRPHDEKMTLVPRKQSIWTGDVFKAWYGFIQKYPKIKTEFVDEKYGIGLIWKSKAKVESGFVSDISFAEYKAKYLDLV